MTLFPDLGTWLLRSVGGSDLANSPLLAVERLSSQPRPIQDGDKDTLVGAILAMGSSLHHALHMLLEVLPEDSSRERLSEVLCPTLGHLLASLQNTLSSLEQRPTVPAAGASSPISTKKSHSPVSNGKGSQPSPERLQTVAAGVRRDEAEATPPRSSHSDSAIRTPTAKALQNGNRIERFPLESGTATHHPRTCVAESPDMALVGALRAEMRVQAALRVAVDSLEFAEDQLKLVKEVNQLHGGSFDILQRQFYNGYNRLLFRALELERREFGLSDRNSLNSLAYAQKPQGHQHADPPRKPESPVGLKQSQTISFEDNMPTPKASPRLALERTTNAGRRPLARRNTILGIKQEGTRASQTRAPLKRRLSLAEELAMVHEDTEDSESGPQESSEAEGPSSESGDSHLESEDESRNAMARGDESEEYSTTEESTGELSDSDGGGESEDGGDGDKTIDALESWTFRAEQ